MADRRRPRFRRHEQIGWAAGGQVVSALSNALLVVVAAQSSTPAELGGLALVLVAYRLVLAASRALVSEPLITLREADGFRAEALHAAALVGGAGGLACLAAAAIADDLAAPGFVILAVGLPFLMVQDVTRYLYLGQGVAARAARVDLVWLLVQLAGAVVVGALTTVTVELAIATWAAGGFVAAVVGLGGQGVRPGGGWSWLRRRVRTSSMFVVEYAAIHSAVQGTYLLVASLVSSAAAGALRGIETLFGPHSIVVVGTRPTLVQVLQDRGGPASTTALRKIAVGLIAVAVATATGVMLLPGQLGELVLGETWPSARSLAPTFGAYAVAVALSAVPMVGLRAIGRPGALARARSAEAVVSLGLVTMGALWADTRGAVVGLTIGSLIGTTIAWRALQTTAVPPVNAPAAGQPRPS